MNETKTNTSLLSEWGPLGLLVLSLIAHAGLKAPSLHWYISDENIYYYMARDMGWKVLPYRDFFYANPPLLLPILKASGCLFGWGIIGLRLVPTVAHLGGGIALYRMFRSHLGVLSLAPVWVYLWSHDSLRAGTHATGITETLVFILWAYWFAFHSRGGWAGLLLGMGLWTKTYAITALPGLLVALYRSSPHRRKESLTRFITVLTGSIALLAVFGTLIGGRSFWEMNVSYHLSKESGDENTFRVLSHVAYRNQGTLFLLGLSAVLGVGLAALQGTLHRARMSPDRRGSSKSARRDKRDSITPSKRDGEALVTAVPAMASNFLIAGLVHFVTVLAFLLKQGKIFDFYLLLFLPALSFWIGAFLMMARSALDRARNSRRRLLGFSAGYSVLALFLLSQPLLCPPLFRHDLRLFARDWMSYLNHLRFSADDLEIWKAKIGGPGVVLTGDSGTAPLLAILTGNQMALHEADTNQMRFLGGFPAAAGFIKDLEKEPPEWLVVRGKRLPKDKFIPRGMFEIKDFERFAYGNFELKGRLKLESDTEALLMRRKGSSPSLPSGAPSTEKAIEN